MARNGSTQLPNRPKMQLAKHDIKAIAERYANGESMQVLAAENAVHRSTLYRWLLGDKGDKEYQDLVTHCLIQRVAEGDAMIQDPNCDIARAREVARYARMDLERRRPALYGAKQQINVEHTVKVDERLVDDLERILGQRTRTCVMSNVVDVSDAETLEPAQTGNDDSQGTE